MELFKRWRSSRSGEHVEQVEQVPSQAAPQVASPGISSGRPRRPATMGRTASEQAYLAQAAHRAKQE